MAANPKGVFSSGLSGKAGFARLFSFFRPVMRSVRAKRGGFRGVVSALLIVGVLAPFFPASATTCATSGNNITISSSCIFDAGTYTFTGTLTINSGVTITAASNVGSAQVIIISDNIDVQGTVSANGTGFASTTGTGQGTDSGVTGGGAGHGGNGGNGFVAGGITYGSVTAPVTLGSGGGTGSGGAGGGAGGGAIKLQATGTVTVAGTVSANGSNGGLNAGGGSGGSVWIDAGTLAGGGTVTANGGSIGSNSPGSGGGGRIAVFYTTDSSTLISGNKFNAIGGTVVTGQIGGAGTVFLKQASATNGQLIVDNNERNGANTTQVSSTSQTYDGVTLKRAAKYVIPTGTTLAVATGGTYSGSGTTTPTLTVDSGGTLSLAGTAVTGTITLTNNGSIALAGAMTVASGTFRTSGTLTGGLSTLTLNASGVFTHATASALFSGSDLIVNSGGTFVQETTSQMTVGTVTVNSGGTIMHADNSTAKNSIVNISATTFTINSGGIVSVNESGFNFSEGTGQGTDGTTAGGGGYCGAGGNGSGGTAGGTTYGSSTNPDDMGSGGGNDTDAGFGGAGAGEIKIQVSGVLTVNGTISANGGQGSFNQAGGGSGGTVNLNAGSWAGTTGSITANGGAGAPTGAGATGGGGGGAGRVFVGYGAKTYTGTIVSTGGAKGGTTSAATAGGNCTPVETATSPTITSVAHTPSPTALTTDVVTLTTSATYTALINKIEIFLDGTAPANLKHACNFSPAQSPASCQISVGFLAAGSHTTTVKAYGTDASVATATETFTVTGQTTGGTVTLGRSKVSVSTSFRLDFVLSGSSTGTLTVTLPGAFTVTAAGIGGSSSACLSGFGFTATTLSATKTGCTGTVTLAGATVTNPATPGAYAVTWTNDNGSASVFITSDDQVGVTSAIDPTLTMNVGSQASATACDGTFAGNGGTVALGALTTASVTSSDAASVPHICARISTNAGGGAAMTVKSLNGSLKSTAVPADAIPSNTSTLAAGTAGYGLCAGSAGADSGKDATTPTGATPARSSPFNGTTCTSTGHDIGAVTTSAQNLWTLSGPSQNAFFRIYVKAAVSTSTQAHNDYADTLTFVGTGTY